MPLMRLTNYKKRETLHLMNIPQLIKFLEERTESHPELVAVEREVLERACTVHHLDKPELHLHWAHFEEAHGNAAKAAEILDRIEKTCACLVQIQYRLVWLSPADDTRNFGTTQWYGVHRTKSPSACRIKRNRKHIAQFEE